MVSLYDSLHHIHDYNGRVDSVWTWLTEADSRLGVAAPTYPAEPPKPQQADIVYDYTKTGQVATMEYPQISMLVSYAYNHRKWLDSMVTTLSSSPVFKQVLSYDPIGQITQQRWQHGINPEQTQYYTYDSLQRLTAYGDGTSDTANYTYDAVGNREYFGKPGTLTSTTYTYFGTGPNQLSETNHWDATGHVVTGFGYNPDGAIAEISKQITPMPGLPETTTEKFRHSWRSLLQQYHHLHGINGAEELWSYRYSASGEREQKRLQMSRDDFHILLPQKPWVYYLLGGSKEQLAVYHVQELDIPLCGTTLGYSAYAYPVEYNTFGGSAVRLTTRPDALLANGIKEYIVTDHLGSTRLRVDQNGMLIDASDYEPFGKAITGEPRQGYIGKEKDLENGLGDFGVRKYDAEIGRFLSVDPLWEEYRAWTPYHYVENNPLSEIDPSGLGGNPIFEREPNQIPDGGGGGGGRPLDQVGPIDRSVPSYPLSGGRTVGGTSSTTTTPSTVRANNAAGTAYQAKVTQQLNNSPTTAANQTEVTVQSTTSGTRMRVDNLIKTTDGKVVLNESKASTTAPLTKNQKTVMQDIHNGAQVIVRGGNGGEAFPAGTPVTIHRMTITVQQPDATSVVRPYPYSPAPR